jgi:hypothetical protein
MIYQRQYKFEVGDLVDYYTEMGVVVDSGHDTLESMSKAYGARTRFSYYIRVKHPGQPTLHKIFEGTAMWDGIKLLAQGRRNEK